MEPIGGVVKNMGIPKPEVDEISIIDCRQCGEKVKFKNGQYKRYCPKCGMAISRGSNIVHKKGEASIQPDCMLCDDSGLIYYTAQVNGHLYNYVARCVCPEGAKWNKEIPIINQCKLAPTLEFIENSKSKGRISI
ncbi:MAG: hypothetical protein ACM3TR_11615 [Caulobacteraceae bacterium]